MYISIYGSFWMADMLDDMEKSMYYIYSTLYITYLSVIVLGITRFLLKISTEDIKYAQPLQVTLLSH